MKKPTHKDYGTDHGIHSAMQAWARSQDKPHLIVKVEFIDGSCAHDIIEPATREVSYRTHDGEVYTVDVDTAKFKLPIWAQIQGVNDTPQTKVGVRKWLDYWYKENNPKGTYKIVSMEVATPLQSIQLKGTTI